MRRGAEGLGPMTSISQSAIGNRQSAILLVVAVIGGAVGLARAGQGLAEPWRTGARGLQVAGAPREIRQGDIFLLEVRAPEPVRSLAGRFGRREAAFWPGDRDQTVYRALVGADLEDAPGPSELVLEARSAAGESLRARLAIAVQSASFPVQRLTVPRPFSDLDPSTLARVQREQQRMGEVLGEFTPRRLWDGPFRVPLDDAPAPHGFGARRIVNGEARASHNGADYAVPAGTPVRAAQGGTVVLAEEHFFPGRAVVIDHGLRLFTMYFHLQETRLRQGEAVRARQVIGSVGASGRVTGAHLHWGARLGGARVDPTALVRVLRDAERGGRIDPE